MRFLSGLIKTPSGSSVMVSLLIISFLILIFSCAVVDAADVTYGDINSDGEIDVRDVVLVMRYILEIEGLTDQQRKAADVNYDGKIDVRDASLIMQYALGLIDKFPKEMKIDSVEEVNIKVPYGTFLEAIDFPATVEATLHDQTKEKIDVDWEDTSTPEYNPLSAKDYIFIGELVNLPTGVTNPDQITARATVTIYRPWIPVPPDPEVDEVDKAALEALIGEAQALKEATGIGDEPGQASQEAHDDFQDAIDAAQDVYDDPDATQSDVDDAEAALQEAIEAFEEAIVPLPEVTSIEVTGAESIIVPAPGEETVTETYTATVKDQYGGEMPGEDVNWSLADPVSGVSIDADGVVTVTDEAEEGSFTVITTSVTDPGVSGSLAVALVLAESVVTSVEVSGPERILIPASGEADVNINYTAVVFDQYGAEMPGEDVNWSLADPVNGVSIDADGVVTVTDEAEEGSFTVVATSITDPGVSGSLAVALLAEAYDLTFVVEDEGGAPLEGAAVEVIGIGTETTDASGEAVFEALAPGNYSYTVSKAGYDPETGSVDIVDADVTETVTLDLLVYNLNFSVEDEDGIPIEGASVLVTGQDAQLTDENGVAVFADLVPGSYDYTVSKAGYQTVTGDLLIIDQDVTVPVTLEVVVVLYDLSFVVTDIDNNPIEGAEVAVDGVDTKTTTASGEAVFLDLAPGSYDYTVSKTGYVNRTGLAEIIDDDETVTATLVEVGITYGLLELNGLYDPIVVGVWNIIVPFDEAEEKLGATREDELELLFEGEVIADMQYRTREAEPQESFAVLAVQPYTFTEVQQMQVRLKQ